MKPRIVITAGDPAGIGPEIVAAAVRHPRVLASCDPIVVGDPVGFTRYQLTLPKTEMLAAPGLAKTFRTGKPSREAGISAIECLKLGVGLIESRQAHGLVTAPVSKESLHLAGAGVPGHTEWLAQRSGVKKVAMLMAAGPLRALLMTRHIPIRQVAEKLTRQTIFESAELGYEFCRTYISARPRLVLCGLNPHAGDAGLIGTEEQTVLGPALRALKKRGIPLTGPIPADSAFRDMVKGAYTLALAAYHDQGMIPLKVYAPDQLVNITLGLPYIRTSPGHGTAYDIAGKHRANPAPMIEAICLAAAYSRAR